MLPVSVLLCFFALPLNAAATETAAYPAYYVEVWDRMDGRTRALLSSLGVSETDPASVPEISPCGVLAALKSVFSADLSAAAGTFAAALGLLAAVAAALSFCPDGETRALCEVLGAATVVFLLAARVSAVTDAAAEAIRLTSDFIRGLLPAFCAVVSFSGAPAAALGTHGVVLAFSETVSAFFAAALPGISALGAGLAAAEAVSPGTGCGRAAQLLQKGVNTAAGFVSGIFVAVLSVKNVAAGAADSAAAKGLRFLISGSVPLVGSAVGEALGSVLAGLGVLRAGVGLVGALAVAVMNLFPLSALLCWRVLLALLSECALLFGAGRVSGFLKALGALLSVLTAVLCFNSAVYIIALAAVASAR